METELTIGAKTFRRLIIQRGESAVYRGEGAYLRIGEPARMQELLRRHELLLAAHYPVAAILERGEHGPSSYFIEESLGDERFGLRFRREWEAGAVSDEAFDAFLEMTLRFTRAQMRAGALLGPGALRAGINLTEALRDAPNDAARIEARIAAAERRLSQMPIVACHGDFNPQNMLPRGTIDFEDMFAGPLGYDQVSGIYTTELNPEGDYEFPARYRFTGEQISAYYAALDDLFTSLSVPSLSSMRRDLEFCRAVWAATRMRDWPKTQAWRYRHLGAFFDDTIPA